MRYQRFCALLLFTALASALVACGGLGDSPLLGSDDALYVTELLKDAQSYQGKTVTVNGAYLERAGSPNISVLAIGVSTLDNGLDAQPMGDQIWVEGFPEGTMSSLHQPGDAVYGFVRIRGEFDAGGGYGPNSAYQYRIRVASAEPIEVVKRTEVRVSSSSLGDGKVAFLDLMGDSAKYAGQVVTTQGYYFWNGAIYVLAEGISTEEDGSSPQPIGKTIWMEGFPPDQSSKLHLGPNNSFVWGFVEVTGDFKSGGGFGKDGAYASFFQVTSARVIEDVQK